MLNKNYCFLMLSYLYINSSLLAMNQNNNNNNIIPIVLDSSLKAQALAKIAQKLTHEHIKQANIPSELQELAITTKHAFDRFFPEGTPLDDPLKYTALLTASVTNNNLALEALLLIPKNAVDRTKLIRGLLFGGSWNNDVPLMEFFIKHHINLNAPVRPLDQDTALHIAARSGKVEMIKLLLDHGAQTDVVNLNGQAPLDTVRRMRWKTEQQRSSIIQALTAPTTQESAQAILQRQAQERDFIVQASVGNIDTLQHMLSEGIDINAQDGNGNTALMVAARVGRADVVKFLLAHSARADIVNRLNQNAHVLALSTGQGDIAQLLPEPNIGYVMQA